MRICFPHLIVIGKLIYNKALRFTPYALRLPQVGIFFGRLSCYFAIDGNSETHADREE
jgi:hypothetical protein